MSMITKFYEEYITREDETGTEAKSAVMDCLNEYVDENEDMMRCESMITEFVDAEAEKAFTAGFKKAFELLLEAIA